MTIPFPNRHSSTFPRLPIELSFSLLISMHPSFWNLSQLLLALSAVDMENKIISPFFKQSFIYMKILIIPPPVFSSADFQFTLKEVFSGSIIILVFSPLGSFLRPPSFLKCHAPNRTQYSSRSHSALGRLESSCVLIPMSTLHLSFLSVL